MENKRSLTAMLLRIEKSSLHDGEGLRTVVFLKGCNLRCRWCSTPESQHTGVELGDGACYGREASLAEVFGEVLKDEVFYFHSGGGLTVSGGEPLLQAAFVTELLKLCRSHAINTALESNFCLPWEQAAQPLPYLDTLFVDVKHCDSARHRQLTGAGNEALLHNLMLAGQSPLAFGMVLRLPLIPGLNDDEQNLRHTAALAASLGKLKYLEILPYHRLGSGTYAKLGREYSLAHLPTPSRAYVEEKRAFIAGCQAGLPVRCGIL
jgi:pyruvate formate lyase activating enzyme